MISARNVLRTIMTDSCSQPSAKRQQTIVRGLRSTPAALATVVSSRAYLSRTILRTGCCLLCWSSCVERFENVSARDGHAMQERAAVRRMRLRCGLGTDWRHMHERSLRIRTDLSQRVGRRLVYSVHVRPRGFARLVTRYMP